MRNMGTMLMLSTQLRISVPGMRHLEFLSITPLLLFLSWRLIPPHPIIRKNTDSWGIARCLYWDTGSGRASRASRIGHH